MTTTSVGTRALWQAVMGYGAFDRMPVLHWGTWTETHQRWLKEGLEADRSEQACFNAPCWSVISINHNLLPAFEEITLGETAEQRVYRDGSGVIKKAWKDRSGIPQYMGFTLKSGAEWEQYRARLQPDARRVPSDLEARIAAAEGADAPLAVEVAPMMGWIRNWMGVENLAYLAHDTPGVFGEMVATMAELSCWGLDQILPRLASRPDLCWAWEDICGRNGPLVSPEIFDRCVAPGYRRVREKLASYGVEVFGVDSDGWVEPLVGHWLDAGVNLQFPVEIGVWKADPAALRRKFGRELRIFGGIDKRALAAGRGAIDAELERRRGLMAEGGYVPLPDHLIPPEVALDDYRYYLEALRAMRF